MKKLVLLFLLLSNSLWAQSEMILDMAEVKENFAPLPKSIIDENKNRNLIELGKTLYFEKKLSVNDSISCNSCHQIENFGVDNEPTSPGWAGKRGGRNSPTSLNAALHMAQFWDGRAKDVEEQALGPILNPDEMGMPNEEAVIKKLSAMGSYEKAFKDAFPKESNPMKFKNIGIAIGAYERTLLTPSRFDDFLNGDQNALTAQEKRGLKKFMHKGCITCHSGTLIGGDSYQKLGAVEPYKTSDLGRYEVTKDEDDKYFFKVPSLRNVSETAPYFHDGSVKSLDEAIRLMAWHQLGERVGPGFINDVKAFLEATKAKRKP